jgi:pilus assembly protein CpaC
MGSKANVIGRDDQRNRSQKKEIRIGSQFSGETVIMNSLKKYFAKIRYIFIPLLPVLLILLEVQATASSPGLESIEARKINLSSGKSIVLRSDSPIQRISIANPNIVDYILMSPHEIYLTAKEAGTTNLMLWRDNRVAAIYDLVVRYDISDLKQRLHEILPEERDLRVMATNDSITLAGKLSNASSMNQALSLAQAYAPEGKIQNLTQVGGVHQVMLEVRISEMSRQITRRLGINFAGTDGDDLGVSLLGSLGQVVKPSDAALITDNVGFAISPAVNALFRFSTGDITWTGFVDALREDGLIKILAEPTLITLSGQSANFLAGGEFPVPVPQGLGTVAIEYKPFGVGLVFTPIVLSENKISIQVSPEVSDIDYTTAITLGGYLIPGLRTRRASTSIELGDGQSFAIAGLLRESVRSINSEFPILGRIPILGPLFQSKKFQKEESELIIIVTPHLVKPLDQRNQPLPTDFYVEPNDVEFYLFGKLEGSAKDSTSPAVSGELDGEFGHSIPDE